MLTAKGWAYQEAGVRREVLKQRKQHIPKLRTMVPKLCAKMPYGVPQNPQGHPKIFKNFWRSVAILSICRVLPERLAQGSSQFQHSIILQFRFLANLGFQNLL